MAQRVWRYAAVDPGSRAGTRDDRPDRHAAQAGAASVQEEGSPGAAAVEFGTDGAQVASHHLKRHRPDRDQALLPALPEDEAASVVEVQVAEREPDKLADAHAGRVEEFQHRTIPPVRRRVRIDGLDDPRRFILRQKLGELPRRGRTLHAVGGVARHESFGCQEAEIRAQGRLGSPDRCGRKPVGPHAGHVPIQDAVIEVRGLRGTLLREEVRKTADVGAVGRHRCLPQSALERQVVQEGLHPIAPLKGRRGRLRRHRDLPRAARHPGHAGHAGPRAARATT